MERRTVIRLNIRLSRVHFELLGSRVRNAAEKKVVDVVDGTNEGLKIRKKKRQTQKDLSDFVVAVAAATRATKTEGELGPIGVARPYHSSEKRTRSDEEKYDV